MNRYKTILEAKLGKCARCMRLTALLTVLSWAVLAALMRARQPSTAWLVILTLVSVLMSMLGIAHAAAFLTRRVQSLKLGPQVYQNTSQAVPLVRTPSDCGCGSGGASHSGRHKTIFVQIASYRDPQLPLTIADCLANARHSERLIFGICWQRDASERLDAYIHHPQFRWIEVPYQESRGVCWARHQIQGLYAGEDYTLHIDSHHRFAPGWDEQCIEMIERLQADGIPKPLLTAYPPSFNPSNDPADRGHEPCKTTFAGFTPDGLVLLRPTPLVFGGHLAGPVPARFYSGGFAFTLGQFCLDVPHDPAIYFQGEEINITARAFTHGYDLYHPNRIVLWHEYTRVGSKHWNDHPDWYLMDARSHQRVRVLLGIESAGPGIDLGPFGLGTVRSLRDYERYAGIYFGQRAIQQYTLDDQPPPNPCGGLSDEEWVRSFCRTQQYTIRLSPDEFPAASDCNFWFVGAHDESGREIHRQDLSEQEIQQIDRSREWTKTLEFLGPTTPVSWTVWPHSRSKGWQEKLTKLV